MMITPEIQAGLRAYIQGAEAVKSVLEAVATWESTEQAVRESQLRLREARALEEKHAAERAAALAQHQADVDHLATSRSTMVAGLEQARSDLAALNETINERKSRLAEADAKLAQTRAQHREFVASLASKAA